jgi:hypothetical protein
MAYRLAARKDMKRGDLHRGSSEVRWAITGNPGDKPLHPDWLNADKDYRSVQVGIDGNSQSAYSWAADLFRTWHVIGRVHFMPNTDIIESIELFDNDAVKPVAPTSAQQCTCGITELMRYGCRCGGV